jgi:hypothetical protein
MNCIKLLQKHSLYGLIMIIEISGNAKLSDGFIRRKKDDREL